MFNAINTINFNGFLGFELGDKIDFALSRMRHLGMISIGKIPLLKQHVVGEKGFRCISVDNCPYDHIKKMSFVFLNDGKVKPFLTSIKIFTDDVGVGLSEKIIQKLYPDITTRFDPGLSCVSYYSEHTRIIIELQNTVEVSFYVRQVE